MRYIARALTLAIATLAFITERPVAADQAARPLLLELFTSQSCSSCPPADALLHELARQPDLLALEFHVDYWNNLGWVDPYSSPAFTARQQMYSAGRGFEVYTPQLIIDGRRDAIGSDRPKILSTIALARGEAMSASASISRNGNEVKLAIGALSDPNVSAAVGVYLLSFDSSRSTYIHGGENSGRNLSYTNVVVSMRKVGEWRNHPLEIVERLHADENGSRLALIAQDATGLIWAVATTPD